MNGKREGMGKERGREEEPPPSNHQNKLTLVFGIAFSTNRHCRAKKGLECRTRYISALCV